MMNYRDHTIEKSGFNYRVKDAHGNYWGEIAVSVKTAKRWIDAARSQSQLCADYDAHLAARTKAARAERFRCNQCEALMIQGVFCHETGCLNARKRFIDGEWVSVIRCRECGNEVTEGERCCDE